MKTLVVKLTGLFLLLFAAPLFAQTDSVVCIKPQTARWFLEQSDKVLVYETRDSLNTLIIDNLSTQVILKDSIISTFREDSLTYQTYNETIFENLRIKEEENKRLKRNLLISRLIMIGEVILIILIVI